jgi:hypothetical protein
MSNRVKSISAALIALLPAAGIMAQDTIVVRADNAPEWGTSVRLVRELRIGALDGAPEYTFGRISSVTAGPDGSIFVVDAQVPVVRQYDAAGKHVRSFGRRGTGPGELQNPEAVAIAGSQLVVRDIRNRRFVVYPLAGGEPSHWNYQSSSASFRPIVVHTDGAISTPFSFPRGNGDWQQAVLRYDPDGAVRDTLNTPRFGAEPVMLTVAAGPGGGRASYSIAYLPAPVWVFTAKRQFIGGLPSRYSVVIVDGRSVKRIDRGTQPVTVSAEERNELMSSTERTIRSANDPNFKWNGPEVPSVKPFYKEVRVDSEERIWVHLHGRSIRVEPTSPQDQVMYREPVIYDVISSAGRYLGQIRFPDGFVLHHIQGSQVWGTERGELDVQYVVRYGIQMPGRSR